MITPNDLDRARAEEASRQVTLEKGGVTYVAGDVAIRAARLAREGWQPTDPLLLRAREIVAGWWEGDQHPAISMAYAQAVRAGHHDRDERVQIALRALTETTHG